MFRLKTVFSFVLMAGLTMASVMAQSPEKKDPPRERPSRGEGQPPRGEGRPDRGDERPEGRPGRGGDQPGRGMGMMLPKPGELMPAFMMQRLNFTDAQKKQLADLQKMVDTKLAAIMTDEQKETMKTMMDRMKQMMEGRGGAEGRPGRPEGGRPGRPGRPERPEEGTPPPVRK